MDVGRDPQTIDIDALFDFVERLPLIGFGDNQLVLVGENEETSAGRVVTIRRGMGRQIDGIEYAVCGETPVNGVFVRRRVNARTLVTEKVPADRPGFSRRWLRVNVEFVVMHLGELLVDRTSRRNKGREANLSVRRRSPSLSLGSSIVSVDQPTGRDGSDTIDVDYFTRRCAELENNLSTTTTSCRHEDLRSQPVENKSGTLIFNHPA